MFLTDSLPLKRVEGITLTVCADLLPEEVSVLIPCWVCLSDGDLSIKLVSLSDSSRSLFSRC